MICITLTKLPCGAFVRALEMESKTATILCIDDEPLLRELLKEVLEREGHRVEVTDGGQSGLDAFRAAHQRGQPFDIVITDLGMPYLDGRQVAKTLKRESPETPIVLLTGWGAFMKEDGLPAQVDGILPRENHPQATSGMCRDGA